MQESHWAEWYREFLATGYHVEGVRYDLADLIMKAEALVTRWQNDRPAIELMVERAANLAFEHVNAYAQVESMAWALLDAWQWGGWKVNNDTLWRTYSPVNGSRLLINHFLSERVRSDMATALSGNFGALSRAA